MPLCFLFLSVLWFGICDDATCDIGSCFVFLLSPLNLSDPFLFLVSRFSRRGAWVGVLSWFDSELAHLMILSCFVLFLACGFCPSGSIRGVLSSRLGML